MTISEDGDVSKYSVGVMQAQAQAPHQSSPSHATLDQAQATSSSTTAPTVR